MRPRYDPKEFYADCFAGALLMPKTAVERAFALRKWAIRDCTPDQVYAISNYFGVGYTTLVHHLSRGLLLLSSSRAEQLLKIAPRRAQALAVGWETPETVWVVDEHWVGRPIDVEAGDFILLHEKARIEGNCAEPVEGVADGRLLRATDRESAGLRTVQAGRPSSGCPGAPLSGEMSIATKRRRTISGPLVVVERNLSVAWGKAFLEVFESNEIAPLVVVIEGLDNADPPEVPAIRSALDDGLRAEGKGQSCSQVANTIFPDSLWNLQRPRADLYQRYLGIVHRIRKHRGNRHGVYFQRLIAFGADIEEGGRRQPAGAHHHDLAPGQSPEVRATSLSRRSETGPYPPAPAWLPMSPAGCFRTRTGDNGLAVTGFYAKQHMFERAYGNYLGLCHLGRFMAHEMGLTLSQVVCIATPAARDRNKRDLAGLARQVESSLLDFESTDSR